MPGNAKTLDLIKRTHAKLVRLDPEYGQGEHDERPRQNKSRPQNQARQPRPVGFEEAEYVLTPVDADLCLLDLARRDYAGASSGTRKRLSDTTPWAAAIAPCFKAKRFEFNGESKTIVQWAAHVGLKASTIQSRITSGWSIDAALTVPSGSITGGTSHKRSRVTRAGWQRTSSEVARTSGGGTPDSSPKQAFFQDAAE